MQSIKQVLAKFNPEKDKYVSRELQAYGISVADMMNETERINGGF